MFLKVVDFMINNNTKNYFFLLVQIASVCVFLGRAWQHLFWDAPFRTLLWDEFWMKGLVENFSTLTWKEYITSSATDTMIQRIIQGFGIFYLITAMVALRVKSVGPRIGKLLLVGSFFLACLAALYCKEKFYSIGQFLEYALQFSSPLFLYALTFSKLDTRRLVFLMKVALAFTFVCHGLYAFNYYPRPGNFVQMVIDILGVSESTSFSILNFAAIMDFLLAVLIFFPPKIAQWALLYAFGWGLATSLARVWANFYWDFPLESLHQWGFEMIMRLPHALIPLALWWEVRK